MSVPMFKHVEDGGKFQHPWFKALPPGRARFYDLAYKTTSAVLFGATLYGLFELGRGSAYILSASSAAKQQATPASSAPDPPSTK